MFTANCNQLSCNLFGTWLVQTANNDTVYFSLTGIPYDTSSAPYGTFGQTENDIRADILDKTQTRIDLSADSRIHGDTLHIVAPVSVKDNEKSLCGNALGKDLVYTIDCVAQNNMTLVSGKICVTESGTTDTVCYESIRGTRICFIDSRGNVACP